LLGITELKREIEITETTVECPVEDCNEKVEKQRGFFTRNERFKCPRHHIYISPTTFEYENELNNLLWKEKVDQELLQKIKQIKRECRMARDNSEDAVTWNVFRFLEKTKGLSGFLTKSCNSVVKDPELIYWSYSQSKRNAWRKLIEARCEFGEAKNHKDAQKRGSEPDLIVKSDKALFFIEVKLTSTNNTTPSNHNDQKKYLTGGDNWFDKVFKSDYETIAIQEKKYELLRFWLIGTWIAEHLNLDFYLINLTLSDCKEDIEKAFKRCIKENDHRRFMRITWEDVYKYITNDNISLKDKEAVLKYFENKSLGYKNGVLKKAFSVSSSPVTEVNYRNI